MSSTGLVSVTVLLLAIGHMNSLLPRLPQFATVRAQTATATSGRSNPREFRPQLAHLATRITVPWGPRSSQEGRGWRRDPLKNHRAVVGRDAHTPWYIRVRAVIVLVLIVISMGMAIAGATLLLLASGRFLLETLAG